MTVRGFSVVCLPVLMSQEGLTQCFSMKVITDPFFTYVALGFIMVLLTSGIAHASVPMTEFLGEISYCDGLHEVNKVWWLMWFPPSQGLESSRTNVSMHVIGRMSN